MLLDIVKGTNGEKLNGTSNIQTSRDSLVKEMVKMDPNIRHFNESKINVFIILNPYINVLKYF